MKLEVADLAVARGGVAVLAGVTFSVGAGEALVLRGPNGIGKTTVLRTLAGLQPPVAGRIAPGPDHIAYAGHADAIKAPLTVTENLEFWARIYGAANTGEVIREMELGPLAGRYGHALSAGQKRRLGLARLLLSGRGIWLLDEPTVSLDQASVALFAGILSRHLSRGGVALLATHIDLGLPGARTLDLSPWRATGAANAPAAGFDEAFL